MKAVEPEMPGAYNQITDKGIVEVAVALDERGSPLAAHVVKTPSKYYAGVSEDAAMRSTYRPTIFRCVPVPGQYTFAIGFGA